ncbi:DUF488 domain-containing protein [Flavobacterium sp. 3HN19-14]|uniref:DUF488 domain-containing protein n=1 Tax=Flavobacterium sp. 3HN19-14 TaxID=3448133 RepID=UPI003EE20587
MFYRRKVILALLQSSGSKINKLRIQKLIFLFAQRKKNPDYEFIPYKFGCYSYSLNADLITMIKKGNITEDETSFFTNNNTNYVKSLEKEDQKILNEVLQVYGSMDNDKLIKHTYINFPYYAINSLIAKDILTEEQQQKVNFQKAKTEEIGIHTIGYEGVSLEAYINKLIKNNIKLLVDVRRNPLSQKYGFSKTAISKFCGSVGIDYVHIPEVGIDSSQRQELNSQADYDSLFKTYSLTTLIETEKYQKEILNLLSKYKRIALTCFEADICQCHRKPLVESIAKIATFDINVKHI